MRLADRYRVERRVGEGGGGGVFLVRDRLSDDAQMVLKRLHAHAQAGVAQWLVNEFQILAQLDLRSVARVFDFGLAEADAEDPGGAFFTREFVDGVPLDSAMGPAVSIDGKRLVELFTSAAETLHALHRLGVVHGDLKPANMIVPHAGGPLVLIDFGLAHGALGAAARIRGGTLAFMPPERRDQMIAGESLLPDPRADLYSLSASLLMLLGLESVEATDPAWLSTRDDLRPLFDLARRGASRDPERRFATADDFLATISNGAPRMNSVPTRVVLRPEGREAELGAMIEQVGQRLVRREVGDASLLLVGDEGSGRSTLLRELTWRAQLRGVQVLLVQGEAGDAPARRLREGAEILSGETIAAMGSGEGVDFLSALRKAAQRAPVLILADDLDRADPAIASQLRSIAYGTESNEPLLVIASSVSEQAVADFSPARVVPLGPLEETAIGALCTQTLGPVEPSIVSAIRLRTGGSPAAVTEMLIALAGTGGVTASDVETAQIPPRARDLARRRVRALPGPVRRVAEVLAGIGQNTEPETLMKILPDAAVNEARASGVVVLRGDGKLALSNGALADALLGELDPKKRIPLFRRIAATLDAIEDTPPTIRAAAFVRAAEATEALRYAPAAIASYRSVGLPLAAAQLLKSICDLDEGLATPARLLEQAELYAAAGATAEALSVAVRVTHASEVPLAQSARLLCGKLSEKLGDFQDATAMFDDGLARAIDGDAAAEFMRELALVEFRQGRYSEAAHRCEQALQRVQSERVRALVLSRWGLAMNYLGDSRRAIELLEESLALFSKFEDPREEAKVLAYLAISRQAIGDLAQATALTERTLERARAAGDIVAMASARLNLGSLLDQVGDLAGALDHFGAAAKLAKRSGDQQGALLARINIAGELIRLGSYERARSELDTVLTSANATLAPHMLASATGMLGVVRARLGDTDEALTLISTAIERFRAIEFGEGVAEAQFDIAELLLDRGGSNDLAEAEKRLLLGRSSVVEIDTFEARSMLLEARIALARGDTRGAQKLLGPAIDLADTSHQWEVLAQALSARAKVHQAVGAEIHARRDRERAMEVLESTASSLPPDLRSAFWTVAYRGSLRTPTTDPSWQDPSSLAPPSVANGAHGVATAQTVIAQDHRLVLLLELSRRVGEEQTLQRVLDQAVRSATELTNAERGAILVVGTDGSLLVRARSGTGIHDGPDDQFSRSISETVLIDGEVVSTHNARGDARFADFRSVHELAITAVAAVPIRMRGRTLGVLYVENRLRRTVWSPSDLALMKAFAEQAGIAIEHARLIEDLEARSSELELAKREIEALLDERTEELESTRKSLARAEEALKSTFTPKGIIAQTESMRKLFAVIHRVRDTDVPIVIEGESGTGKELVARAIHYSGARQKGPFVVVHCGAIPETLLESELFGHVKGAFTGADRDRKGLIASAHQGTLMLDEMAEMPLKMQVELLRVLQERRIRKVGAEEDEPVDIRVVSTVNRSLVDLVSEGKFRQDVYYRLSVVTIKIPPLRARLDDIGPLASHFLTRIAEEHSVGRKRLSRDALARLLQAPWPGNVRQLRHVLESAAVLTEGDVIEPADLALDENNGAGSIHPPPTTLQSAPPSGSPMTIRKATERQRIIDALEQVNWNKVRAATVLGMPRRTLYRRLREYGLLEE